MSSEHIRRLYRANQQKEIQKLLQTDIGVPLSSIQLPGLGADDDYLGNRLGLRESPLSDEVASRSRPTVLATTVSKNGQLPSAKAAAKETAEKLSAALHSTPHALTATAAPGTTSHSSVIHSPSNGPRSSYSTPSRPSAPSALSGTAGGWTPSATLPRPVPAPSAAPHPELIPALPVPRPSRGAVAVAASSTSAALQAQADADAAAAAFFSVSPSPPRRTASRLPTPTPTPGSVAPLSQPQEAHGAAGNTGGGSGGAQAQHASPSRPLLAPGSTSASSESAAPGGAGQTSTPVLQDRTAGLGGAGNAGAQSLYSSALSGSLMSISPMKEKVVNSSASAPLHVSDEGGGLSTLLPAGFAPTQRAATSGDSREAAQGDRSSDVAGLAPVGVGSSQSSSMDVLQADAGTGAAAGGGVRQGVVLGAAADPQATALLPTSATLQAFFQELEELDSRLDSARAGMSSSSSSASKLGTAAGTGRAHAFPASSGPHTASSSVQRILAELEETADLVPPPPPPPPAVSTAVARAAPAGSDYASVRAKVLAMSMELEEKGRTIGIMRSQLQSAKRLLKEQSEAAEEKIKTLLFSQKQEFEGVLARHLGFIDQLLQDKKSLAAQVAQASADAATAAAKAEHRYKAAEGHFQAELVRQKDAIVAGEASRRQEWQAKESALLKARTLKGLEPQIQSLLDKHKEEMAAIRAMAEEQVAQAAKMFDEKLAVAVKQAHDKGFKEAEATFEGDRQGWRARERQLREEAEAAVSAARARWAAEVEEERSRISTSARSESDRHMEELSRVQSQWQAKLGEVMARHAEERETAMRSVAHAVEAERMRCYAERDAERAGWEARAGERMKRELAEREDAIRAECVRGRDEAIRQVMTRMEADIGEERRRMRVEQEQVIASVRSEAQARLHPLQEEIQRLRGGYEEAVKGREAAVQAGREEGARLGRELQEAQAEAHALRDRLTLASEERDRRRQEVQQTMEALQARVAQLTQAVQQATAEGEARLEALRSTTDSDLREVQARVAAALRKRDAELGELRVALAEAQARAETATRLWEQGRAEMAAVLEAGMGPSHPLQAPPAQIQIGGGGAGAGRHSTGSRPSSAAAPALSSRR